MKRTFLTIASIVLLTTLCNAQKRTRSTETGQYVPKGEAKQHPRTTVQETGGNKSSRTQNRDAESGRYVSPGYSEQHPKSTQTERPKRSK